jgi:hypothetical protein
MFTLRLKLAAALLLWPCLLCAQGPATGALHGNIGRAQPGAEVKLHRIDDARDFAVAVAADGTFLLPHLAPGEYELSLTSQGRTVASAPPLTIVSGATLEVRATLSAGGSLAVIVSPPALDATPPPDENGDGLVSLNGLEATQDAASIDGASATQSYNAVPAGAGRDPAPDPDGDPDSAERTTGSANGMGRGRHAGVAYVFSQASVREFRVAGRSYSAQTGHAGAVETTVSRSGGSALHGSGSYVLRSQAFAASEPLSIATSYANGIVTSAEVKPHDLRQNFAASLGGPAPRARALAFFYTIDLQRRGFPAISSPANPQFYNLTAIQQDLLLFRGVSAAATNTALNYLSSLTGSTPRRADQTLNFGRIDWHARAGLTTALEYNAVRWSSPAGLIDAPVVARGRASLGNATGSLDLLLLRVTKTLNAHTVNEARVSFLRDEQFETPQTPLAQEPAISLGGLAPEVNIAPQGLLFGTPATLSQLAYPDERRVQLADTLTLVRGHHLIQAGAELSLVHDHVATLANAAGTFSYDSGSTNGSAGGLVDFITDYTFNVNRNLNGGCPQISAAIHNGCFRSFSQSFGETSLTFSTQEWAAFAEDTWRPRAGLTIHAGARYEYTLLPTPNAPNAALDAVFGSRGATGVFPADRNNVGPRVAVSYEPFGAGRGIVRAGAGVFFGRMPGATLQSALSDTGLAGSTTRIRIRPNTPVACPQVPQQGFGYPCAFLAQPSGVVAMTTSAMVFDRYFRLPAVTQASLSFERTLGRGTRLSATYVFNSDRQLPGSTDLNIAPSTASRTFQLQGGTGASGARDGETFLVPVYTSRISPTFGPVTDIVSNVNATYNGLTLAADSQPVASVHLRGDYTWSKAIDYGQNQSATPRTDAQFDPFTKGYDKGLSSLNYPWALRILGDWTPQVRGGSKWMRRAANGWSLIPIASARSGRPYTLDISGGTYLAGGHESINGSGGALYLPTVGRNTLRMPATANVDLRAARAFRTGRATRVFAAVEAFNLLNHTNVSSVEQRAFLAGTPAAGVTPLVFQSAAAIAAEGLNTQPFGSATSTGSSLARERQVQLSVRVEF